MNSLGNSSKFLGTLSRPIYQVGKRNFVEKHGDEDIKWQWSVRDSPCQECHKYKTKKGWLHKFFKRQDCCDELTNRRQHIVNKPKFWEWEYYDYLLPECKVKLTDDREQFKIGNQDICGDAAYRECEGKRILVQLGIEHRYQKPRIEKFGFETKEPFSINQVCGKMNTSYESATETESSDEEKKEHVKKDDFCCLNNLIDEKKEEKEDKSKE